MKAEGDPRDYPVPCRGCGMVFHRVRVQEGTRLFTCPRCGRTTEVWIVIERGVPLVRSALRRPFAGGRG